MVVGLHLGLAELIMAGTEEVSLSPATLCFRDNIRGSWFVGINQPPNINRKSANKLGFIQKVRDFWTKDWIISDNFYVDVYLMYEENKKLS